VEPIHWEILASREEAVKREQDLKTGFGRKWLKREYEAGRLAAASRQAGKPDSVEFEDGTVFDLTKQDFDFFKMIKPMVWW